MNKQVNEQVEESIRGLSAREVAERVGAKQVNHAGTQVSRSISAIISANLFTFFNLLLIACVIVTFCFGSWKDTVFGIVLVVNALTGIVSEIRAKITLDRMSILDTAPIEVIREGKTQLLAPDEIVLDEVLKLKIGDQVPVDGVVLSSQGFRLDESNLTGESVPQLREAGDNVMSGSAVVSGKAVIKAQAVGEESWANQMSAQVKKFVLARSELQEGIFKILRVITWILPIMILLLFSAQIRYYGGLAALWEEHFNAAVVAIVAAIVGMIPQGLVLLTSVNFATAAMKLARKGVLVQELPAVEVLARVDMLCLDKTGTLTTGEIVARGLVPLDGSTVSPKDTEASPQARHAQTTTLAPFTSLAAADIAALWWLSKEKDNATASAIAQAVQAAADLTSENSARKKESSGSNAALLPAAFSTEPSAAALAAETPIVVPFDSARKWSALCYPEQAWVLGAPEIVLGQLPAELAPYAQEGARVLVLARAENTSDPGWQQSLLPAQSDSLAQLPSGITPVCGLVLAEELRADAAETLAYFQKQGVDIAIISGDNPVTVGALSKRAGLAGGTEESPEYDARNLPTDLAAVKQILATKRVFGRVTPEQKRLLVQALQDLGKTVAMTGDGVNDALALKDADLGIAMGNAASATKAASKIVLVKSQFSALPAVLLEGRRVLGNMERVSTLFLSKTVYAVVLALAVGALGITYPYLPRHLTLVGSATIGIPAFILALAPSNRKYRPGFLKRVGTLVVPAGIVCASASICAYLLSGGAQAGGGKSLFKGESLLAILRSHLGLPEPGAAQTLAQASSVATIVLVVLALVLLAILARPLHSWRGILVLVMTGIVALVLAAAPLRNFFALVLPDLAAWIIIAFCAGSGLLLLVGLGIWWRRKYY